MRSRWIIAAIPAGVGLLVAALIDIEWMPYLVISLRANLDALSIYTGIGLSLLTLLGLWLHKDGERASRRHIRQIQEQAATRIDQIQEQAATDRNRIFFDLRHELANPVTRLNFQVAALQSIAPDCIDQDQVAKIKAVAHHLGGLTEALENLHWIETGLLARAPVHVGAVLEEVIAAIQERPEVADRSLDYIEHRADPFPLPPVNGNEHLLNMELS